MTEPRWLTDDEMRAWLAYRRMRNLLDLQINRDLAADAGLSEQDYDVLSTLSELPEPQLRVGELSDRLGWSRSRLSHHMARMERRGLVIREDYPGAGRGAVVKLTETGARAVREAAPGHVASVRRHLIDRLSAEEIRVLGDIGEKVLKPLADGSSDDA
ncbi:MarR family transcriptional regulator [Glycomyces sp. TRM65418]|uniref:MarR family winged helix-turn-helix transcriptional regulator n=1 Tax=Glycomyces sp. TRM65418 TaxID=2867006 RepID=UPI001CE51584|nr:MarR family transcriptional regulator [Glycomyces sp. TRM65418]MCC3764698.1 MarR family transcriptional regulator [Glycomyces sp. TRM65418]QZD54357.1 MarR family transcriptional regulator [Glycomyces sp. TRM65418]